MGKACVLTPPRLQANAALKSWVRRDAGQSYEDYLRQLATL
jgi:hypothetical protein